MPIKRDDFLQCEAKAGVGVITLNRPLANNATTLDMIRDCDAALTAWAEDSSIRLVLVRHRGPAFCSGLDMADLHQSLQSGNDDWVRDYFREESILNHHIFHYPKPYISIINGSLSGDGVGLGLFGSHRIVSEHTSITLSETDKGFITDGGATYLLARFPGYIGTYLGLTGAIVKAADAVFSSIATHFVPTEHISALEEHIMAGGFSDKVEIELNEILRPYAKQPEDSLLATYQPEINRCFSATTLEDIFYILADGNTSWHQKTLQTLMKRSPTCLKATHRLIRAGRRLSFDAALELEYRVAQHAMRHHDFAEGLRAFVTHKDEAPLWQPDILEAVSTAAIDGFFQRLADDELVLKITSFDDLS